jgi:hypothetical protein
LDLMNIIQANSNENISVSSILDILAIKRKDDFGNAAKKASSKK